MVLSVSITVASAAAVTAAVVGEDFSSMPIDTCFPDGTSVGSWRVVFSGFGCTASVFLQGNVVLMQRPAAATWPGETHAALAVGPSVNGDFTMQVMAMTSRQLRTGSAPAPWEVAWVVWNYTDNARFYYFIPKPNGWELGKADPAYPGGQRFLATGSTPAYPIGTWHQVSVAQSGRTLQVAVNGTAVTSFIDRERPYTSGRVGLYTEDAEVYFDNVSITTPNGKRKQGPTVASPG
jgi:hypothetical protein